MDIHAYKIYVYELQQKHETGNKTIFKLPR